MALLNRYSTGNPVYRGVSSAPTRGKVNPTGYVDRQMRSGLAAAAVKKLKVPVPTVPGVRQPTRVELIRQQAARGANPGALAAQYGLTGAAVNRIIGTSPTGKIIHTPVASPAQAPVNGISGAANAVGYTPTTIQRPNIDFSAIQGLLNSTQLPFDSGVASDQNSLNASKIDFGAQAAAARARLEANRAGNLRQIDQQQPLALEQLLNNFASRGMAYSGGYGTELGKTQDEFANARSQVDTGYNTGLNDLSLAQNSFDRNYTNSSNDLTARLAAIASQNAGQLGIQDQLNAILNPQTSAPILDQGFNGPVPANVVAAAQAAPANRAPRAATRVELINQEQAKGAGIPQLAKKYGMSIAAIVKILQNG